MNGHLCKAIEERRLISFGYKGAVRLVEPHVFGMQPSGIDAMVGWQRSGGSGEAFRFFRLDEVTDLMVLDERFSDPRFGYSRGDRRFARVYAEL